MSRIDVETEFAACVRKARGSILADELGPSPSFANADYLFREDSVVAELKCLERDTRTERPFVDRVSGLYRSWVRERLVPARRPNSHGHVSINSSDLPLECTQQILELLKTRLRRIVTKANKQIKETKRELGLEGATGLLVLANDGDMIMEFDAIAHLLCRVLKMKFRHINTVLYFTANQPISGPQLPVPAQLWADLVIDDGGTARPAVPRVVLERLKKAWFHHLADLRGSPTIAFDLADTDPDSAAQIRFQT